MGSENQESIWRGLPNSPACMERHLEGLQYRADGAMVLGAAALTGRYWMGSIWVYKEASRAPEEAHCTAGVQTEAGLSDVAWLGEKSVVVASDTGALELWKLAENDSYLTNCASHYEHDDLVCSVSVGVDTLVSGSLDGSIKVWDKNEFKVISTYRGHVAGVGCVSCAPKDQHLFLSCAQDGRVLLWDTRKAKPASVIDVKPAGALPSYVTWNPFSSRAIAVATETGHIGLRDLSSLVIPLAHTVVHNRPVTRLKFSPHSAVWLASAGEDCRVIVSNAVDKLSLM
uniref:methylosome protein WDR77 n=1 Tax=Myxine glutinosa TaxID=7769 RepID=UPI00358DF933